MKFLMIYPNNTGNTRVPLGVVYLLSILRNAGHDIRLFDMTFYGVDLDKHHVHARERSLNFRPVDLTPYGVTYRSASMADVKEDLLGEVEEFAPDLIGITITEDTSMVGFELANAIKGKHPDSQIVFGGVFCMANPEMVIMQPSVDMICVGEGELALSQLLNCLQRGKDISSIQGIWVKTQDNAIVKNPVGPPIDLDSLPLLDMSLIDDRHFYLPMAGHVYKMAHIGSQRGCPRRCNYCCNQIFLDTYKDYLKQYLGRKMSIPRLIETFVYLKDTFAFNFFQIIDDDFLVRSLDDIKHFHALYTQQVNLPFWIQAEANHITDEKIHYLKEAGCIAIAIGIETGSDLIRREVYNRHTSKETTLRAFEIMHKHCIRTSANVILGVPLEGRREVFETIDLVRKCRPSAFNVNVFAPFHGTVLRKYCVEKGYLDNDFIHNGREQWRPVLDMPQIAKSEIEGLMRAFPLYVHLDEEYWPMIRKCEDMTEEGDKIFAQLSEIYWTSVENRGMDYDVPGFDYDAFLQKRRGELERKEESRHCREIAKI